MRRRHRLPCVTTCQSLVPRLFTPFTPTFPGLRQPSAKNSSFHLIYPILLLPLFRRERNNAWALEQAKANVLRWYPVVGVLDCMEETVRILERTFPYFFEGASIVYNKLRESAIRFPFYMCFYARYCSLHIKKMQESS